MKKFLFTLAALFMAGSAFADSYLYIEPFTITEAQIEAGQRVEVKVKAHFDARVSAFECTIDIPADWELFSNGMVRKGADMTISYLDVFGDPTTVSAGLSGNAYHAIGVFTDPGYEDEAETSYGVAKWEAGDYENMYSFYIMPKEGMTSATLTVTTLVSSGADTRGGTVKENGDQGVEFVKTAEVTVEGGTVEPEVTEKPVITWEANDEAQEVVITVTGAGELVLYNDDIEVARGESPLTYTVPYTEDPEGEEMGFSATAQEEGKEVSEYALATVEVPGKPAVQPEVTEKPVITWEANDEAQEVVITVTGAGELVLYNDDIEVARGESPLTYTVPYTDDPEGEEMGFSATAQEEGKEVSEYALATVEVPGKPAVQPEVTEAPVVTCEVTDDAVIITATGDGDVILYVNDEAVENPYTIARPEAGEDDIIIFVYATAQEEGKEIGKSDVQQVVVEAQEGGEVPPVDPHAEGYWLVTYDMDGNEIWTELTESNGDYNVILRCSYGVYGTFDYYGGETRPDIVYYIVVDGVRYGAAVDGTLTVLGEALQNPLTAEYGGNYVLGEGLGKVYNMGVAIDEMTGEMYVYAAVAGFTEIDEMNAGKAVAGVRYFNMAGQEMQEANGMTIVVTTYTDGTTSAVKVMK